MNHLEVIRIRLFNLSDRNQVNTLFRQFKEKLHNMTDHEIHIAFLKNSHVENDWSIHLTALKETSNKEISSLAAQLVETFRTIGMVNHDAWEPVLLQDMNRLTMKQITDQGSIPDK